MKVLELASSKCREIFPDGIRIGSPVKINFPDGASQYMLSKAVNPFCSPESLNRDGSGRSIDMYHSSIENGHINILNGTLGVVTYIYVTSSGEPFFHVYIEDLDTLINCSLSEFGIYDEFEETGNVIEEFLDEDTKKQLN